MESLQACIVIVQECINTYYYELSSLAATTDNQGKYAYTKPAIKPGGSCPTGDTYLIVKMTGYKDYSSLITFDCGT
jgi:hypothetical protein